MAISHGLRLPVRERTPEPLGGAVAEVAQPDWAEPELNQPDAQDDHEQLPATEAVVHAQAIAVEDQGADDARAQVVGERHATDGGEPAEQTLDDACLVQSHQESDV